MNFRSRKFIMIAVVALLLLVAGCAEETSGSDGEELSESTGVDVSDADVGESYWYEVRLTEANQNELVQQQPPFLMDDSLERQNLRQRFDYLNDRNNIHHVYFVSHDGKVINYEVAQGKVSSVNSKLTNAKQIVREPDCRYGGGQGRGAEGSCFFAVESPQMDGSYGENGDAIFFFTTDGHYVEWNGLYVVSEEPKGITTEVTLTEDVGDDSIVQTDAQANPDVIDADVEEVDEDDLTSEGSTDEESDD